VYMYILHYVSLSYTAVKLPQIDKPLDLQKMLFFNVMSGLVVL
jgi:hypothetical protein